MPLSHQQCQAFREQAAAIEGIDVDVYEQFGRDPLSPIIGLGPAEAGLAIFGRDPGREEVRHGVPFIGAGGQLVRRTLYQSLHQEPMPDFQASLNVGRSFFWANTVPYKPIGNKAWSMKVKRRFQPLMTRVLLGQWQGRAVITLGREAFLWFGLALPRERRRQLEAFWKQPDRFESSMTIELDCPDGPSRTLDLFPLPHPSPLNATWYKHFPDLLTQRLLDLGMSRA